jgi:hypothetical protein
MLPGRASQELMTTTFVRHSPAVNSKEFSFAIQIEDSVDNRNQPPEPRPAGGPCRMD